MRCKACGAKLNKNDKFCVICGTNIEPNTIHEKIKLPKNELKTIKVKAKNDKEVRCPICNSTQIQFVTKEEGSDYSAGNGCCGLLFFGPIGLICGLLNDKETKVIRKCLNCKTEF